MPTQRLHPVAHVLFAHGLSSLPEVHATSVQRHLWRLVPCEGGQPIPRGPHPFAMAARKTIFRPASFGSLH